MADKETRRGVGELTSLVGRMTQVQEPSPQDTGAALLASLVTLTPGSTVVDIGMETRCLLVHLLDGRDQAGAAEGIRRHFERHVRVLCGVKS